MKQLSYRGTGLITLVLGILAGNLVGVGAYGCGPGDFDAYEGKNYTERSAAFSAEVGRLIKETTPKFEASSDEKNSVMLSPVECNSTEYNKAGAFLDVQMTRAVQDAAKRAEAYRNCLDQKIECYQMLAREFMKLGILEAKIQKHAELMNKQTETDLNLSYNFFKKAQWILYFQGKTHFYKNRFLTRKNYLYKKFEGAYEELLTRVRKIPELIPDQIKTSASSSGLKEKWLALGRYQAEIEEVIATSSPKDLEKSVSEWAGFIRFKKSKVTAHPASERLSRGYDQLEEELKRAVSRRSPVTR